MGPVLTVNPAVRVPTPASGLVTSTSRRPIVAPSAIVMFAVSDVALLNVVELTVIPLPENETRGTADEAGAHDGDVLIHGSLAARGGRR